MGQQGPRNPEMLAKRLFKGMKHSELPDFKQVIEALEAAKGEKFTLSADELQAVREEGKSPSDDWCGFCDKPLDECTSCDASDWKCNGEDSCVSCDEGDTCNPWDT
jgi:hypothetical protein